MPRAKKTLKVEELSPMTPIVTRDQYIQDIKIRWAIHQYEVSKLIEDVKKGSEFVKPYIQQTVEFVKETYQREFGPKTTV